MGLRIRDGVRYLRFDNLGYCTAAERSYTKFRELRAAGRLPKSSRFQMWLPFPRAFWCSSATVITSGGC